MTKSRNYKENDYQVIVVKKELEQEVIYNYECFGWVVQNKTQHSRYENLIEIEMSRNHFIENKDDLQFLQVNMESDIIKRGRLGKEKHSKSTIFGISFALLAVMFLTVSVLNFIGLLPLRSFILGIICASLGVGIAIMTLFTCVKMVKRENISYKEKEEFYTQSINHYILIAKELMGAKDGE